MNASATIRTTVVGVFAAICLVACNSTTVLPDPDDANSMYGRVTLFTGYNTIVADMSGSQVEVADSTGTVLYTRTTDSTGVWEVRGISRGIYTITATHAGYADTLWNTRGSHEDVVFRAGRTGYFMSLRADFTDDYLTNPDVAVTTSTDDAMPLLTISFDTRNPLQLEYRFSISESATSANCSEDLVSRMIMSVPEEDGHIVHPAVEGLFDDIRARYPSDWANRQYYLHIRPYEYKVDTTSATGYRPLCLKALSIPIVLP